MKKIFILLTLFITADSFAQGRQRKSPHDTLSYANGEVIYGRPYKSGREIFGGLVEYGKVWRVGADEATTISFKSDTKFGGKGIPAGTYTLFALVNEKEWTLILNSQLGQWGAFSYDKNKDKDVAKVTVPVEKAEAAVEQLTIRFADGDKKMIIEWNNTGVVVDLSY
jgi:hypothetical protein